MTDLLLRRASTSRPSGEWDHDDFDVFDGDELVGRIYRLNAHGESWWWGLSFSLTGRRSNGRADALAEAQAAFQAAYESWVRGECPNCKAWRWSAAAPLCPDFKSPFGLSVRYRTL